MQDFLDEALADVPGTIALLGVAGSHAFGLAHAESDTDYRGVYVAPTRELFRLTTPPDAYAHKSPDVAMHEVGRFLRLAAAANPTALETLSYSDYVRHDAVGGWLLGNRELFITDKIRATHLGFAKSQFEKLKKRYDPWRDQGRWRKHARHTYRIIRLTEKVLTTGEYDLVVEDRDEIFAFGEMDMDTMVYKTENEIARIEALPSVLPPGPDMGAIDRLLIHIREDALR